MFYFPGCAVRLIGGLSAFYAEGFPHSDIFGSKVAQHLPEAYRRYAASFIALSSQGIHRTPLFPLRKQVTSLRLLRRGILVLLFIIDLLRAPYNPTRG